MKETILSESPLIKIYNGDNIDFMKTIEDNKYDLAIVDPPYGIGKWASGGGANTITKKQEEEIKKWDAQSPKEEYWKELFRVSKKQIAWGGNYFMEFIGKTHKNVIVWDKKNRNMHLADGEVALTNLDGSAVRIFDKHMSATEAKGVTRIHPTQKPIILYRWLLENYARSGYKILDTHLGSGSICLAVNEVCKSEGVELEFDGVEISEEYYENIIKRFKTFSNQETLF